VREQYVRPPLVPREAPAAWRAVWAFRLTALVLLALAALVLVLVYRSLSGATSEDPGVGALPPPPALTWSASG